MNEREREEGLAPTPGYRYADLVGNRLLVAGQVPHDAQAQLVGEGDARAQTRQVLSNLFTLVATHGFERADIHRLVVYVVGEELSAAWDEVRTAFGGEVPPATLLGVARLGHSGQLVEIDAHIERA